MPEYKYIFSVIIPVYNVEAYLEETLESVINQDIGFRENIQIILVNDGSPDNSGKICERYRDMYPENIKYVIKENGGVSSARNMGLEYAEGEYINFLDSDDKWDLTTFRKVYGFFAEHKQEIDLVSVRIKQFDAKEKWHILDYKFTDGTCVADLTDKKEYHSIQLHVSSAFIKREAIGDLRFNEKVKFGEDSLFANAIILKKLKCGIVEDCFYYYRKRADRSSATQMQKFNIEYYTVSPELYYKGIIELSQKQYGCVVPYIQSVLAYDIGWRVRNELPEEFSKDKELYDNYYAFLKESLSYVEDIIFLTGKAHKRISVKEALYKIKHDGEELKDKTFFDVKKKAILFDDIKIYNFKKSNKACYINICEISNHTVTVEGLISKWVMNSCPGNELEFVLRVGKKKYKIPLEEYHFSFDSNFFGKSNRYYRFKKKIDITKLLNDDGVLNIRPAIRVDGKLCNISVKYGKFVANNSVFEPCYKIFGSYIMICSSKGVEIRKSENIRKEHIELEKQAQKWLRENGFKEIAVLRLKSILQSKTVFRGKQLWLISDRTDKAGDNGEAFFRYLCSKPDLCKNILPVFVTGKQCKAAAELTKIGKVIYFEDEEKYKRYFLCADKIISSSGGEFATNPLNKQERIYLTDLIKSKLVFLSHGILNNDLSGWLHKYNKNISLFIAASQRESDSLISGNYMCEGKNVSVTGLARYDLLQNNTEKKIAILPTWRRAIKESYDSKTQSVYFEGFKETEFFRFYNELINNERLLSVMRERGYKGLFGLHPIHVKQSVDFKENDIFEVKHGFLDYKNVFSTSSLMVTDYSSVFFDFAYLRKPVVYAQFDKEKFYEGQIFDQGYFDPDTDGFGPVCRDLDSTVDAIISSLERDCENEQKYLERIDSFFEFSDKNNCERIYRAILKI